MNRFFLSTATLCYLLMSSKICYTILPLLPLQQKYFRTFKEALKKQDENNVRLECLGEWPEQRREQEEGGELEVSE